MPYIANQQSEEEKKKQQAQQGGSFDISGQSTSFNQAQNTQPSAPKPQARSGSWVNLNQYLDANKENSNEMADKIASNVETQATKASDSVNALKSSAPGVVNSVNADDWFSNPDGNKKNDYLNLKNTGGYTGPDSVDKIDKYSDYQSEVNKANSQVGNLTSETGRFNLLQDTYARPQYSQGMKKLDNVLLQKNDDSKAKFEDLNNKYKGILDLFNTESNNIGNQINTNIQTAAKNKNDLVAGETKARQDLINPIQARANQINQTNPELINRVNTDLSDDVLSDETMNLLGLSDGQSLYDLDLNSYVNPNFTQAGLDNAANAEERARYAALAAMIDDPTMNQITNNGSTINPMSFNKDQFSKDIAARQTSYQKALNDGRYTGNGSAIQYGNKKISDMSYAELEAALPAMKEQQRLNNEASAASAAQGNPMFFQNLPVGAIEEILNSLNNSYKTNRKIARG